MITHILALAVGFIAGFLVFRNNSAKAEKVVQAAQAAANKLNK